MKEKIKKASLSRSQGKDSWCIIFRHPLVNDVTGMQKLRVRRGLGTTDKEEAQALVDQMNKILAEPAFHKISAKAEAEKLFDRQVVAAFYDRLEPATFDSWTDREAAIPMPGPKDGHVRTLFLGATGAGKTTLVRQLIGTDPHEERFPSTSAAKTTTCNIEVIMRPRESEYEAVVSFLPEDRVRQYIEDCVTDAAMEHVAGGNGQSVARKLILHAEQRFRLNYILGTLSQPTEEDEDAEDELDETKTGDSDLLAVDHPTRERLAGTLRRHLQQTVALAEATEQSLREEVGGLSDTQKDRDAFEELFEDTLRQREEFGDLVDAILDDVAVRFELVSDGLTRGRDGWPKQWNLKTADRGLFLRAVNQFSSNYAPHFGRLLTPLVEGIRVAGPFIPKWASEEGAPLVLIDGEGLGHTPDSAFSISTSITRRYDVADAILLVDNAAQPMQAASCAVLRSLVASGHENKLVIAFTHFDDVKGDNLPTVKARKVHVQNSVDNAVASIGAELGRAAENALKRATARSIVFLASIDEQVVSDKPNQAQKLSQGELTKLVALLREKITPAEAPIAIPEYDDADLGLCIQKAMQEFREPWRARLGFPSKAPLSPVHWTRIKALTRRLGELGFDEYDTLRPVADMIARLSEHISSFLSAPSGWTPAEPADDKKHLAIDIVERGVFSRLHKYAKSRLFLNRVKDWGQAYSYRGTGSASKRATEVERIYESATPIPNEDKHALDLIQDIRALVRDAIKEAGAQLMAGRPAV